MDVSFQVVALAFAAFLTAGLVKGVIGLGLPSISIGILAMAMPPAQAALIMIVPSLVTNVWQMLVGPHFIQLMRRMWTLLLGGCIGMWLGGGVLTSDNTRYAALGLGFALILYGVVGLTGIRFSISRAAERWWSFPVGLATGLLGGATGVFVLPAGMYFQAVGMEKDELVQMLGISFTVSTVVLGAVLWRDGVMQFGNTAVSVLSVLPALLGMVIGQRVRALSSPEFFRTCMYTGLLGLGIAQVARNLA